MGVEYYVVDKKNKTFYELGKGSWFLLREKGVFSDPDFLHHFLVSHVCKEWVAEKDTLEYVRWLAYDLHGHFGSTPSDQLVIINDCGDELFYIKCMGYRCVGTRFGDPESDTFLREIAELNQHLGNPRYRPERAEGTGW